MTSERSLQWRAEQVRAFYEVLPARVVASIGIAIILLAALWTSVRHSLLLGWFVVFAVCSALRLAFLRSGPRVIDKPADEPLRRYHLQLRLGNLLAGIVWGCTPLLFLGHADPLRLTLVTFTLAGLAVAAAIGMAADRTSSLLFQLPIIIPLAARLLAEGSFLAMLLAAVAALYGAYAVGIAIVLQRQFSEMVTLRLEALQRTQELAESLTTLRNVNLELTQRGEELSRLNAEKEVLLGEIHHRVKNNLQVICSLLSLSARALAEGNVIAFAEATRSRVQSLALIHEHLYHSYNAQTVRMTCYLRSLVECIADTHTMGPAVRCTVAGSDVHLPIDRAVLCGLITNELVTNALKHAFPDGRAGHIRVWINATEDHSIELAVEDDGVGTTLEASSRQGFGMRLVDLLAQQLEARVSTSRGAGTTLRLQFAVNSKRAS